jgi:hypothetical protein
MTPFFASKIRGWGGINIRIARGTPTVDQTEVHQVSCVILTPAG